MSAASLAMKDDRERRATWTGFLLMMVLLEGTAGCGAGGSSSREGASDAALDVPPRQDASLAPDSPSGDSTLEAAPLDDGASPDSTADDVMSMADREGCVSCDSGARDSTTGRDAGAGEDSGLTSDSGGPRDSGPVFDATCPGPTFAPAVNYDAGRGPVRVIAADLNRDGRLDLVVANVMGASNYLSILLGNGDGTYQDALRQAILNGELPESLAVGDFDGEGGPDLAVAEYGDIQIFRGVGDGTFVPGWTHRVSGGSANSIVSSDFNRDGMLDLAVGIDGLPGAIRLFFGNGDGTFSIGPTLPAGSRTFPVLVGDWNRDGIVDLAATNSVSDSVTVYVGQGNGTFHAEPSLSTGAGPDSLTTADFNRDGKPDLAVCNQQGGTVNVFLGRGNGRFGAGVTYDAGQSPQSLVAVDFAGDGRFGLAVADSDDVVTLLFGRGDGTFPVAQVYGAGIVPYNIITADFNRDGRSDLAVANYGGMVSILLNGGGCQPPSSVDAGSDAD